MVVIALCGVLVVPGWQQSSLPPPASRLAETLLRLTQASLAHTFERLFDRSIRRSLSPVSATGSRGLRVLKVKRSPRRQSLRHSGNDRWHAATWSGPGDRQPLDPRQVAVAEKSNESRPSALLMLEWKGPW